VNVPWKTDDAFLHHLQPQPPAFQEPQDLLECLAWLHIPETIPILMKINTRAGFRRQFQSADRVL
jgi:hypothetical protein